MTEEDLRLFQVDVLVDFIMGLDELDIWKFFPIFLMFFVLVGPKQKRRRRSL